MFFFSSRRRHTRSLCDWSSDVCSSDLAGIAFTPIEELRELSLGAWEGCTVDEIRAQDGDPYGAWLRAPLDCPPPGGEPLHDVRDRVLTAVDRVGAAHGDGDALIIAHGGV